MTPEFYTREVATIGLESAVTAAVSLADISGPRYEPIVTALLRVKRALLAIRDDEPAPRRSRARRPAPAAAWPAARSRAAQQCHGLAVDARA